MSTNNELIQKISPEVVTESIESEVKIEISNVFRSFSHHVNIPDNNNIVFSGKYGIGKTFFLRKFFEDSKNQMYNPIFISPVNYVVSSNENIFELIKVDIIKQLYLKNQIRIEPTNEVDKLFVATENYLLKNPLSIIKNLSSALSKLSIATEIFSTVASGVNDLIKDFAEFEKELNERIKADGNKLDDYMNNQLTSIGTHIEFNVISEIIYNVVQKSKGKKNVLIIDDLDRLDPEHIFRILNIFSAHNDYESGSNKFGFDKVIIVCDLDNIETIYKHIYGGNTDFEGYIDKFYSVQPFYFNNFDAIKFYLKNKIKIDMREDELIVLTSLLTHYVRRGELTLRKIFKCDFIELVEVFSLYEILIPKNKYPHVYSTTVLKIYTSDIPLVNVYKILSLVFGGKNKLYRVLKLETNESFIPIESDVAESFVRAMVIPARILNNEGELGMFGNSLQNLDYVQVEEFGYSCKVIHKWDQGSPYTGNGSYFQDADIAIKKNSENALSHSLWLRKFLSFCNLCDRKRLFE